MPHGLPQGLGGLSLSGGGGNSLTGSAAQVSASLGIAPAYAGSAYVDSNNNSAGLNNLASISSAGNYTSVAVPRPALAFSSQAGSVNALPFGWISMADPEGRVFYFNGLTGQSQWSVPGS